MELQKPKIALYAKRSFGEKLNAIFDFLRENWKLVLKFITYLLLPVSLVQAVFMNGLMGGMTSLSGNALASSLYSSELTSGMVGFVTYYALYALVAIIGSTILQGLIYGMMRMYNEREEGLKGVTLGMLRPLLLHNIKRTLVAFFFLLIYGFVAMILIVLLALATKFTLLLTIPLVIAASVPLALLLPTYLLEDISIFKAFAKAFRIGFATWGGIFIIAIITGLIGSVVQTLTMLPWYILTMIKYAFTLTGDASASVTSSYGYNIVLYLLGIIQAFGTYLAGVFVIIGLAYQYGHASEVMDNVTVESDIDKFDQL